MDYQQEDLLRYFTGSERQLDELEDAFDLYTGHYAPPRLQYPIRFWH